MYFNILSYRITSALKSKGGSTMARIGMKRSFIHMLRQNKKDAILNYKKL